MLLADSIVMSGSGKAVVLCTGVNTLKEIELGTGEERAEKLKLEHKETDFMKKLRILSEIVGAYADLIAKASLIVFALVWLLTACFSDTVLVEAASLYRMLEFGLIAVALLVVCIPEGMPLVISMAMAFSIDVLKE